MLYEGMSRNGLPVELQVFYGFLFINNHAQGCDADFNMLLYIILGHQIVAFIGFTPSGIIGWSETSRRAPVGI